MYAYVYMYMTSVSNISKISKIQHFKKERFFVKVNIWQMNGDKTN